MVSDGMERRRVLTFTKVTRQIQTYDAVYRDDSYLQSIYRSLL